MHHHYADDLRFGGFKQGRLGRHSGDLRHPFSLRQQCGLSPQVAEQLPWGPWVCVSPDSLGHRRGLSERGLSGWVGPRRRRLRKRYVLRSNE